MLDERRKIRLPTGAQLKHVLTFCGRAVPGFLLSMADVLGIPSGLHASWMSASAALDRPLLPCAAGVMAAMLLQLISGYAPRWEGLIALAIMMAAPMVVHGRGNLTMMAFTASALLPGAAVGSFAAVAGNVVRAWTALPFSALCAPLMYRGLRALDGTGRISASRAIDSMEDRVCVGLLAALLACGGARLMLIGVNVGACMASAATLLIAMYLGVGAGCTAGLISGLTLSVQGLPIMLAIPLAAGGFLAGVMQALGRRWLTSLAFLLGAGVTMLRCGVAGWGCGMAVVVASVALVLIPGRTAESLQSFFRRFRSSRPVPGDAYAASVLASWEKTVDAMALAMPSPMEKDAKRDGAWWEQKLCEGCADRLSCGCMCTEYAVQRAETVWDCREADEPIWQDVLEELRGLGCQRLYHLRESMNSLRREDAAKRRSIRSAAYQRDMLLTHLTAMAGAARRFAMLSTGECWWDEVTAKQIRRVLADMALPVRLMWVRRVQGHAQAAFELEFITGARKQAEELCSVTEAVIGAKMEVVRVDGDRVRLTEQPLLQPVFSMASRCIGDREDVCGDAAWSGMLQDGRFMVALSDGMGHGERAALSARQTVELLRLCLDAGYTRQQTLTAVNGMMLLSGHGERFTTVDLLTIDLWTGQAWLDKLGAAGSWLMQQGTLRQLTGDALPLGIIENIESRECTLRLREGDAVILLTDGVEEAFPTRGALEDAIWLALAEDSSEAAANSLLQAALDAAGGQRRDDQTAAVIRLDRSRE